MTTDAEAGRSAVLTALAANVAIAASKVVGFLLTGSSSMAAEAVHSVADCGNQLLLLVGTKRSARAADDEHPFGHGPEKFFWGFVVSIMLFVLGAGFALEEGIQKIVKPKPLDNVPAAVAILGIAVVLEGISLRTGIRESNKVRGDLSWRAFVRQTKSPDLVLVLLEDTAALAGLIIALLGIVVAVAADIPAFDGVASVTIGALLGAVAVVMGTEMKSLLVGEAATPADRSAITEALLSVDMIDRVVHLRTRHLGPDEILVAVKVAIDGERRVKEMAAAVDEAERRVRAALPTARYIFVEPDVDRDHGPDADRDQAPDTDPAPDTDRDPAPDTDRDPAPDVDYGTGAV